VGDKRRFYLDGEEKGQVKSNKIEEHQSNPIKHT
jgi:hypothetical protein